MALVSLLVASLADVLMGALFAYVGLAIGRRHVTPDARIASIGLRLWWFGIGFLTASDGVRGVVASVGDLEAPWARVTFLAVWYVWTIVLSASMWGLIVYVAYLRTGTHRIEAPLAIVYIVWAIVAVGVTATAGPLFTPTPLTTLVSYQTPLATWVELAFFFVLYLPQLVSIALYLRILRRIDEREARFRVLVTGIGLGLWIGMNLLAAILDLFSTESWQVTKRVLGLAVSVSILLAHVPPPGLRRWFERPSPSRETRRAELDARVRQLV